MENYNTWGVPWQPVVQPHLDVHHGQGRLGHAGGWISGNQGERQGAVRPTSIVKISWTNQIVCFDQPMKTDQSDCLFCSHYKHFGEPSIFYLILSSLHFAGNERIVIPTSGPNECIMRYRLIL